MVGWWVDVWGVERELMKEGGGEVMLGEVMKGEKEKLDYMVMECGGWVWVVRVKGVRGWDGLIMGVEGELVGMGGMGKVMEVVEKVEEGLKWDVWIGGVVIRE